MKKQLFFISALFLGSCAGAEQELDTLNSFTVQTAAQSQIQKFVTGSSCSSRSWKGRGRAPSGYVQGMAFTFARSLCREKSATPSKLIRIMSQADSRNDRTDALAHYHSIFANAGIRTNISGEEALKATYTLGIGLGMRESSGSYCEGWDVSAGRNRTSAEAEAGLFQVSYDSMVASPELRNLYLEYQAAPGKCSLDTFKSGVQCASRSILGSGAGASFQKFTKGCPAFAAEYAMTLLRIMRGHFGPINRREAEVVPACEHLLTQVQDFVETSPESLCPQLVMTVP
jgi:hypothetical protein